MNTRRDFIKKTAVAAAGFYIFPSHVISGLGHKAPSDKLNIAGIGVGGKGRPNILAMKSENIVSLCDVDWKYAASTFKDFPDAKKYKDWRRMYDELGKSIDAVMVATPDHTHALIAATALTLDKHVYCQKPLTHSIYESRLLTRLAAKHKVATQMGHQGNSGNGVRQLCEWIWNGEIGEIKEVHAWTDRPLWPQGLSRPTDTPPVPDTLDWDLFLGPAPYRPYHPAYTPWDWRGWWNFGTGSFGDMGCHVLDPVYQALKLAYPTKIQGSSSAINAESAPQTEMVTFTFPQRKSLPKLSLPEVSIHWYDGGLLPDRPDLLEDNTNLMEDGLGGCLFVGSKDTIITHCGGFNARLLSGRVPKVPETLRRIPNATGYHDGFHEQDWIRACKESPENRIEGSANFAYSGPFNEMVLLGVLAIRLQSLNRKLLWNGEEMKFTNISPTETFSAKGNLTIVNGHPSADKKTTDINVQEVVAEYIKHNYRDGWALPAMP
jgi:predicted dehydrogenase